MEFDRGQNALLVGYFCPHLELLVTLATQQLVQPRWLLLMLQVTVTANAAATIQQRRKKS
jgi:hypothetical protein